MTSSPQQLPKTNVYIDGFNLYYGAVKSTPYRWLDIEALCRNLLPRNQIQRVRYFTARIAARPDDLTGPQRQDMYLRALATLPTVSQHFGHYTTRPTRMPLTQPVPGGPKTVEVMKSEEKGSDVNLATYLLADAFRGDAECFVVISNDSDLTEPMRLVCHDLNLTTGLVNPHPPKKRSWALSNQANPTFFRQMKQANVKRCQLPAQLSDAQGSITKPAGW